MLTPQESERIAYVSGCATAPLFAVAVIADDLGTAIESAYTYIDEALVQLTGEDIGQALLVQLRGVKKNMRGDNRLLLEHAIDEAELLFEGLRQSADEAAHNLEAAKFAMR